MFTRNICLDGTLQECGLCWLGLLAGHGARGTGACRAELSLLINYTKDEEDQCHIAFPCNNYTRTSTIGNTLPLI